MSCRARSSVQLTQHQQQNLTFPFFFSSPFQNKQQQRHHHRPPPLISSSSSSSSLKALCDKSSSYDRFAETKQNLLCGGKSALEIILGSQDFQQLVHGRRDEVSDDVAGDDLEKKKNNGRVGTNRSSSSFEGGNNSDNNNNGQQEDLASRFKHRLLRYVYNRNIKKCVTCFCVCLVRTDYIWYSHWC